MRTIDCTRPAKLYRYSEHKWLVRSLMDGEFRIVPASEYGELTGDVARCDDELARTEVVAGDQVKITHLATGKEVRAIGDVTFRDEVGTNYFTLCFSSSWDPLLFDEFKGSDACLVIHDTEEFCERIHYYAEQALQGWPGIDAPVSYLKKSEFGPSYSKHWKYLAQKEWRFSWLPPQKRSNLKPFIIHIGNIERYSEIVMRPSEVS